MRNILFFLFIFNLLVINEIVIADGGLDCTGQSCDPQIGCKCAHHHCLPHMTGGNQCVKFR